MESHLRYQGSSMAAPAEAAADAAAADPAIVSGAAASAQGASGMVQQLHVQAGGRCRAEAVTQMAPQLLRRGTCF